MKIYDHAHQINQKNNNQKIMYADLRKVCADRDNIHPRTVYLKELDTFCVI